MATFEQVRSVRQAEIEQQIAALLTADPKENVEYLWKQRDLLVAGLGGAGGPAGTDYEYSDWEVTTAHGTFTKGQRLRETIVAGVSTWTDLSNNATVAAPTVANLNKVGGSSGTPTAQGSSYWEYISGYTVSNLSTDNAANTSLNLSSIPAGIDDEDLQASITVIPHPSVRTVFYGGTVAGLSRSRAIALMNDSIRWGFGTALSANEGESHAFAAGPLIITGRPNMTAFETHSTSADYVPTLNVKFNRRRLA